MQEFKINTQQFVFDSYITNIQIEALLQMQITKKNIREVFTCPVNALHEKEPNVIVKGSKCVNCALCDIKYLKMTQNHKIIDFSNIDFLLQDIPHLSILLNMICKDSIIATDVITDGHSRNKRIDLCIVKDNKIYICKIITDPSKIDFYARSYYEVVNSINKSFSDFFAELLLITTESIIGTSTIIKKHKHISLINLIERKLEDGHFN